jgi:predicted transcriptional regulator
MNHIDNLNKILALNNRTVYILYHRLTLLADDDNCIMIKNEELAKYCFLSVQSIKKDLNFLEIKGFINRVHIKENNQRKIYLTSEILTETSIDNINDDMERLPEQYKRMFKAFKKQVWDIYPITKRIEPNKCFKELVKNLDTEHFKQLCINTERYLTFMNSVSKQKYIPNLKNYIERELYLNQAVDEQIRLNSINDLSSGKLHIDTNNNTDRPLTSEEVDHWLTSLGV